MNNSFDKLINRVLDGRYRIESVLGIGGMAYVLKAKDMKNQGKPVAIKILNDEFNKDESAVKRFINESKAVSMISAENIVKIFDVVISDNLKYIVMEFIDGITLKDYVDKVGALGWKEAVHYTKQILKGLDAAHEKGIVHRDVKPQNIMLLKNGHVMVTDFGIAKLPKAEPLTITDKAIGTVNYISPEQASGEKVDFKTDIYSTGVMLYEMVTGKLPFEAESPVAVAMMQVSDEPRPPREINPNVPVGLEQIILKAMSKDADARFSSAAAMVKALDYFVKNPAVVFAQSEGTGGKVKHTSKENQDTKKETTRPMYPVILGITAAFFTVALVSVLYIFLNQGVSGDDGLSSIDKILGVDGNNSDDRKMKIESFVGKIYDENLAKEFEEKGYSVLKVNYVRDETKEQSEIINQDPEGGATRIKPDKNEKVELTLYVNMGAVETRMPDCTLTLQDNAVRYLTNEFNSMLLDSYNSENITIVEENSETVPKGFVIETNPAPNDVIVITKDLKVEIKVSSGPEKETVEMPSVVGKTADEAKRILEAAELPLGNTEYVYSDSVEQGKVVRSSVQAGEEVEVDSAGITLYVSLGAKPADDNADSGSDEENEMTHNPWNDVPEDDTVLEALLGMRENET